MPPHTFERPSLSRSFERKRLPSQRLGSAKKPETTTADLAARRAARESRPRPWLANAKVSKSDDNLASTLSKLAISADDHPQVSASATPSPATSRASSLSAAAAPTTTTSSSSPAPSRASSPPSEGSPAASRASSTSSSSFEDLTEPDQAGSSTRFVRPSHEVQRHVLTWLAYTPPVPAPAPQPLALPVPRSVSAAAPRSPAAATATTTTAKRASSASARLNAPAPAAPPAPICVPSKALPGRSCLKKTTGTRSGGSAPPKKAVRIVSANNTVRLFSRVPTPPRLPPILKSASSSSASASASSSSAAAATSAATTARTVSPKTVTFVEKPRVYPFDRYRDTASFRAAQYDRLGPLYTRAERVRKDIDAAKARFEAKASEKFVKTVVKVYPKVEAATKAYWKVRLAVEQKTADQLQDMADSGIAGCSELADKAWVRLHRSQKRAARV